MAEPATLPLFVYGTLRSGHDNEFARLLHELSDLVATGRARGTLYQITSHYPGLVEDSAGSVTGEIWRPLPHSAHDLLARLDQYEGREYERVARLIDTGNGPVECWVYVYTDPIKEKAPIHSGDWNSAK